MMGTRLDRAPTSVAQTSMTTSMMILAMVARAGASETSIISVDTSTCGRMYYGIGGLSNSCAPWLKGYSDPARSDILDVLFKPNHAASVQVLKLEVGGDAHSTINTESSYMHTSNPEDASFDRGWEVWLATEAKARNPNIRIGGLAWGWPGWLIGSVENKTDYLVGWVAGLKKEKNITVDFLGLQNEGSITGGNVLFGTILRTKLDAAGFENVLIDCCDSHDFSFLSDMSNQSSPFFKAVGALAVHEPLRNAESVPPAALNTGKPIWSSESYTTYSDSNGGGCWARALNWGYVLGNVTSHIAWNLIQSYPSIGSGMNYNGHGLMWAEVPWAGHYVVNPTIWATAHYTQATAFGWHYLPVGHGSGMLAQGGSYVSLVSPDGCGENLLQDGTNDYTLVVQTMEYNNSQCFKDTHPSFKVTNQTATFQLSAAMISKLPQSPPNSGNVVLSVRRTQLFPNDPIDPVKSFPSLQRNRYFEPEESIIISKTTNSFTLQLGINEVVTVSTVKGAGAKGGRAPNGDDMGLAPISPSTEWPREAWADLTNAPLNSPMVEKFLAMDQQGVWEAAKSRDGSLTTTMQQVIPIEPDEWHSGSKYKYPQTFVGPSIQLINSSTSDPILSVLQSTVMPPSVGWAGIGFGGQATTGSSVIPGPTVFGIWGNGSWVYGSRSGRVSATVWYDMGISMLSPNCTLTINNQTVLSGIPCSTDEIDVSEPPIGNSGAFGFLAASYHGMGAAAEFKFINLSVVAASTAPVPPSPPAPPAPPRPMPPTGVLGVVVCNVSDPRQQFTFSGEDGGEAGTFRVQQSCLDVSVSHLPPIQLVSCKEGDATQFWKYASSTGQLSSNTSEPCIVSSHGKSCERCLDVMSNGMHVDLFDCKPNDKNQVWSFSPENGAGPMRYGRYCLTVG